MAQILVALLLTLFSVLSTTLVINPRFLDMATSLREAIVKLTVGLIDAPCQLLVVWGACYHFVASPERRRRMGWAGLFHTAANIGGILSAYRFSLSDAVEIYSGGAIRGIPEKIPRDELLWQGLNGCCCLASSLMSLFLLWMIPSVSKKHLRFFACGCLVCTTVGSNQLLDSIQQAKRMYDMVFDLFAKGVKIIFLSSLSAGTVATAINSIDTWTRFVLHATGRIYAPIGEEAAKPKRRSSALTNTLLLNGFCVLF